MNAAIILKTTPQQGSIQEKFERIMQSIGWNRGALAFSADGSYYLNEDVHRHFVCFVQSEFE